VVRARCRRAGSRVTSTTRTDRPWRAPMRALSASIDDSVAEISRASAIRVGRRSVSQRPTYVLDLGVLVTARRLLYESKPLIEASEATTATRRCNPAWRCVSQHRGLGSPRGDAPRRAPVSSPLRLNADLPQSPASYAVNSAGERPQTPGTRAVSRPEGSSARTTDGGVGPSRRNSAPGRRNACKQGGSRTGPGESESGVHGT
jgi:hypothetical protein